MYSKPSNRSCTFGYLYLIALLVLTSDLAIAEQICNLTIERVDGGYGPYDYTNPSHRKSKLPIVEKHHFNKVTEQMAIMAKGDKEYYAAFTNASGKRKATTIEGDLSYTLLAFPNHHKALNAMSIYQLKGRHTDQYPTADCFFKRAIKYRPNDPGVRSVYGIHFFSRKKYEGALEQFRVVETLTRGDTQNNYNLGLVYFSLGEFEKSREYAKKAYDRGWPLEGLKNKLKTLEN